MTNFQFSESELRRFLDEATSAEAARDRAGHSIPFTNRMRSSRDVLIHIDLPKANDTTDLVGR